MSKKNAKPAETEDSEPHITKSFNLPERIVANIEAAAKADGGRSRSKWLSNHLNDFFAAIATPPAVAAKKPRKRN